MSPDRTPASSGLRVTSAGGVVVGPGGRIAVVRQKGNTWSLPKGRVHDGEDPYAAALREIREETGLVGLERVADLAPYVRSGDRSANVSKTMILFLFRTGEERLAPEDPDNPEAVWLAPGDAVARLSHPADRAFLADVVAAHRIGADDETPPARP